MNLRLKYKQRVEQKITMQTQQLRCNWNKPGVLILGEMERVPRVALWAKRAGLKLPRRGRLQHAILRGRVVVHACQQKL